MTAHDTRPRVAIACQGGGSHTAFTAGVLGRLFADDVLSKYRIVGLSGTSGGAICAMLAWSALIGDEPDPGGQAARAVLGEQLRLVPAEALMNTLVDVGQPAGELRLARPEVSPYDIPTSEWRWITCAAC